MPDLALSLPKVIGGIGIFMLGMIVMTEGLRSLAGDSLNKILMRFTKTPYSGAFTGAFTTAIIQSSSATTIAAVGFVGAGMLSFSNALGIIFGANLGTTITGWMVALLGFKLQIGLLVLPLILVGAMMKLFFHTRVATIGYALAGFGLIFVGIEWMQEGMAGFEGVITPAMLPNDTFGGRLLLLGIGIVVTIITQSSSAGVVTAITMLYAGAISFEQAAALVIGMDVGTTFTAVLASIGGSVDARRTGYSHFVYNLFTAVGALLLITPFAMAVNAIDPYWIKENAELVLVGFHSMFNLLGVILVLPFAKAFATMMQRLVTSDTPNYQYQFSDALLEDTTTALNLIQKTEKEQLMAMFEHIHTMLDETYDGKQMNLFEMQKALDDTQRFIDKVHIVKPEDLNWQRLIAIIHIMDHLQRLLDRCEEHEKTMLFLERTESLQRIKRKFLACNLSIQRVLKQDAYFDAQKVAQRCEKTIDKVVDEKRDEITTLMANGSLEIPIGTKELEAIRWIKRVTNHITSIAYHVDNAALGVAKGS